MRYKVLLITTKDQCALCSTPKIHLEIEKTCNQMSEQGWVLVATHQDIYHKACSTPKRGQLLVFARQD